MLGGRCGEEGSEAVAESAQSLARPPSCHRSSSATFALTWAPAGREVSSGAAARAAKCKRAVLQGLHWASRHGCHACWCGAAPSGARVRWLGSSWGGTPTCGARARAPLLCYLGRSGALQRLHRGYGPL